jgi:hypothetical protein
LWGKGCRIVTEEQPALAPATGVRPQTHIDMVLDVVLRCVSGG